ncbi:MAG: HAD family hydrolase [Planctomycetes bacterium]|nr:HAD family hydrolase [Planctomycetota bacterium]
MPTIRAVVFDLDDTLYPERQFAFSGFHAVAEAFATVLGDARTSAARMRALFETTQRGRIFDAILAEAGRADDRRLRDAMIDAYRRHRPNIYLHADADSVLRQLAGRYRLGIITDGPAAMQSAKVDALELRTRMDAIILTDELGPGMSKPHPRAFEHIGDQLRIAPRACAYVADNAAKDFVAPNALGWLSVKVRRADGVYRDHPAAAGGVPQSVLEDLTLLPALLAAARERPAP